MIFRILGAFVVAAIASACSGDGGGSSESPPPGIPSLEMFAGIAPGGQGNVDGPAGVARFDGPGGIAMDAAGNVYVSDSRNFTVRKITAQGDVTTLAGTPKQSGWVDGPGASARFGFPLGLALDAAGNVYVADVDNNAIRRITPAGVVSTYAGSPTGGSEDGPAASARFFRPGSVAVDAIGNVFVADSGNVTVRRISTQGIVTTVAGAPGEHGAADGPALEARFGSVNGLAIDAAGNLCIGDAGNHTVRKLDVNGFVTTLAGRAGVEGSADGTGAAATFDLPFAVAVDASGNVLVSDRTSYAFRRITPAGVVTTITGSPDPGSDPNVKDNHPLVAAPDGRILFADRQLDAVLAMDRAGAVTTFAGVPASGLGYVDGAATQARFAGATKIVPGSDGTLHVLDIGNHAIRAVARDGSVSTFATLPLPGFAYGGMAMDAEGSFYVSVPSFVGPRVTAPAHFLKVSRDGQVNEIAVTGSSDGTVFLTNLNAAGLAVDRAGNLYIADSTAIRRLSPQGDLTTFAGGSPGSDDGIGTNARFSSLRGLAIDEAGNLFATDVGNHDIRRITPAGVVTTVAGRAGTTGNDDGPGTAATFTMPFDIAVGPDGRLYVADLAGLVVRVIGTDGRVTTLAGKPGQNGFIGGALPGSLSAPAGIAVLGREVFIAMGTGIAVARNAP